MDAKSTGPRCDKCGVAALETWQHQTTGQDLQFCAHHSRQFQLKLYDEGFRLRQAAHA
jgi:hypothetical protein